jgi:hypothetical protein
MDEYWLTVSEVNAVLKQGLPIEAAVVGKIEQGVVRKGAIAPTVPYSAAVYEAVWTHMLRHRPTKVLHMTKFLHTGPVSAYDYKCDLQVVEPTQDGIDQFYATTLARYQHLPLDERNKALEQECDAWFVS